MFEQNSPYCIKVDFEIYCITLPRKDRWGNRRCCGKMDGYVSVPLFCCFYCISCLMRLLFWYRVCLRQPALVMPVSMFLATKPKETVWQSDCFHINKPAWSAKGDKLILLWAFPGIHWSNVYTSPIVGDTASFGWLCWLMLIDSVLYFIIGGYIRMVFPGKLNIGLASLVFIVNLYS